MRILMLGGVFLVSACSQAITLHAPNCTPSAARDDATRVDVEPIVVKAGAVVASGSAALASPSPAAVLTSGMTSDLASRALHGGESGGYSVRCTLERFAIRVQSDISDSRALAALYVDLACEAVRAKDRVLVWRGMLRGRAISSAATGLSSDSGMVQQMTDRAMSDVTREIAGDLALRALALGGGPSQRVFADQEVLKLTGGLDDSPYGALALSESSTEPPVSMEEMKGLDVVGRAAAWNAVAMGAGPGEPWLAGDRMRLDEEAFVRFHQYKALARLGSAMSLGELRGAAEREGDGLLAEFLRDSLQSGGIGLARSVRPSNASAVTNGTTTRP